MLRIFFGLFVAIAGLTAIPAFAVTPVEVLDTFKAEASAAPGFQGFSAADGERFFKTKQKHDLSYLCKVYQEKSLSTRIG